MNDLVEEIIRAIRQLKKDILKLEQEEANLLFAVDDSDEKDE